MIWIKKIRDKIISILNRKTLNALDEAAWRANKLYAKKGNTVVCVYCGGLLPKREASYVYDIEKDEGEYSYNGCWEQNNHVGTLEDMEEAWKEELSTRWAGRGKRDGVD